ncbi:MAG: hypothetical protein K2N61_14545 [Lachnospiraceae bacterium]|nr:hypothetical protein [Lachnospiraceae bacterium]
MRYVEMSTDEAIEVLKKSKGKKVLVAVQDLEKAEDVLFYPRLKMDCMDMVKEAGTILSAYDDEWCNRVFYYIFCLINVVPFITSLLL